MPLFEFKCAACGKTFEDIVSADARPDCPSCGAGDVRKLQSAFAVGRGGGGASRRPAPVPSGGG